MDPLELFRMFMYGYAFCSISEGRDQAKAEDFLKPMITPIPMPQFIRDKFILLQAFDKALPINIVGVSYIMEADNLFSRFISATDPDSKLVAAENIGIVMEKVQMPFMEEDYAAVKEGDSYNFDLAVKVAVRTYSRTLIDKLNMI